MFDGFADVEFVAEGGLGRVYRATRVSTGGVVAIKEIKNLDVGSPAWRRARREAEALVKLKGHPNVVSVEEIFDGPNGPCLVMEYLDGGSIADRLATGPLPLDDCLVIGEAVLAAVGAAHSVGVIHRDLKPHNVLVGGYGQVKVCDFGIAAIAREGGQTQTTASTLAYAAPEELDGNDDVGPPADVYSFSVTMIHVLTGSRPTFSERLSGRLKLPVEITSDRPELVSALVAGMSVDPSHRPTIDELTARFDDTLNRLGARRRPGLATPNTPTAPTPLPPPTVDQAAPKTEPNAWVEDTVLRNNDTTVARADPTVLRHHTPPPTHTTDDASRSPRSKRKLAIFAAAVAAIAILAGSAAVLTQRDTSPDADDDAAQQDGPSTVVHPTEETSAQRTSDSSDGDGKSAPVATDLLNGRIPCEQQHSGKTVTILSPEEDAPENVLSRSAGYQALADCTGVSVVWEHSEGFYVDHVFRLQRDDPPDIVHFPDPTLLQNAAEAGWLTPLPDDLVTTVATSYVEGVAEYATSDGTTYGVPAEATVDSLIWYNPSRFESNNYEVPTSIGELFALSDQIVEDGGTPWCVGAESGMATGWVLTNWIEDFVLRVAGQRVYDDWVDHIIPFNHGSVTESVEAAESILKNPAYLGGQQEVDAIATTSFADAGLAVLEGECFLHRQGSWYRTMWPAGSTVGHDGDVYYFLMPNGGGDPDYNVGYVANYATTTASPEALDVLRYTGSAEFQLHLVNAQGYLPTHLDLDTREISDPMNQELAEILRNVVFRFDASDMMPPEVGQGTFWSEATYWIQGNDIATFLDNVEASWPR